MDIFNLLQELQIEYQKAEHPAVYTCEEAGRLVPELPGAKTKNLFVRDKKGKRHFLIVTLDSKALDLGELSNVLDVSKLSFASSERLKTYLGLEPGAVSLLALVNDSDCNVELIIDKEVWTLGAMQCHPLVNTATLVIENSGIEKLLMHTGHTWSLRELPLRN